MELSKEEKEYIIQELSIELHAKPDGSGKNLIVPQCPYCGHEGGKYGIYIGKATERKSFYGTLLFVWTFNPDIRTIANRYRPSGLNYNRYFDLDGDKKLMISLFWKTMTGK